MIAARPKPNENTWLWLAKLVTGVLVFAVIIVHIVINHLVVSGGLMTFADVVAYLSNPWIALMETFFLVVVVSHSLLGTRSILLDLNPSPGLIRIIDAGFLLLGAAAVIYGIWLIRTIVAFGGAGG